MATLLRLFLPNVYRPTELYPCVCKLRLHYNRCDASVHFEKNFENSLIRKKSCCSKFVERSSPGIIMSSFPCLFNSLAKIERFLREDSQIDFTMHNVKWGWGVLRVDVIDSKTNFCL